jgi:hypothetical protein
VFINRLFREQALERRRRQEPLDDRLQVTAPHEWLLVVGLGVMFVALLAYGAVGSIERSLYYDAVVVLPGERHSVTAPVTGTVVEVLAEVGDTVEPGQAIARVRTHADQQWESATLRLTELLREEAGQEDGGSAELLRLLLAATSGEADGGFAVGGDIVSLIGGEVVSISLVTGHPVAAGDLVALVKTDTPGPLEAVALIPTGDASGVSAGMKARVRVTRDNGDAETIQAQVASISERTVTTPGWLSELGIRMERGHLMRVTLADGIPASALADGQAGTLQVVLGRSSFLSLLAPGGGS